MPDRRGLFQQHSLAAGSARRVMGSGFGLAQAAKEESESGKEWFLGPRG